MRVRMNSWLVRLSVCCVFVGVSVLAIGCGGVPTTPPSVKCYSDRDCPSNYHCDKSVKAAASAEADVAGAPARETAAPIVCGVDDKNDPSLARHCGGTTPVAPPPSGQTAGLCVATPQPAGCYSDSDCKSNQICQLNSAPTTPNCATSSDGFRKCIRAPFNGTCVDKPTTKSCQSDRDCASDEQCEIKATTTRCGGSTAPSGGGGSTAPSGGTDGGSGFRAPEPGCDAPAPAPSSGVCVKRPTPKTCENDKDCGAGETCEHRTTNCGGDVAPPTGTGSGNKAVPTPNCMPPSSTGVCVKKSVPPPPPPRPCDGDGACGKGEYCDLRSSNSNGSTDPDDRGAPDPDARPAPEPPVVPMPPPGPRPVSGICRPKPQIKFCRSNRDCQAGYRCGKAGIQLLHRCARGAVQDPTCLGWIPGAYGRCEPIAAKRCLDDSECGKGQRCLMSGTKSGEAPDARPEDPPNCDPGTNCGGMPAPPPPSYGTCQDEPSTCVTTRNADGSVCTRCGDEETCTKRTP